MVRDGRAALLQPSGPHPAARLPPRGTPGQARHRDPQHLVRHQPLPRPPPRPCAGGQAGRLAGGRLPARIPGLHAVGDVPEAHPDALPQHAGDGDGGAAALLPGRRRRADGRLRQVDARAADGRGLRRSRRPSSSPAGPMLPGHWRDEVLGSGTDMWKYWDDKRGKPHRRLRDGRAGERAGPLSGPLHDDGHRVDPDGRRRSARRHRAGRLVHPGRRLRARPDGGTVRTPHRRTGLAAAEVVTDPHGGGVRGRRRHRSRARRLHQRRHPSHRHGGPLGSEAHPRRLRPDRPHRARTRRPPPRRPVLDGGLPLRRMGCPGSLPG